jgi:polar amino acid transport system substrate-binding protein
MKLSNLLLVVALSFAVAFMTGKYVASNNGSVAIKETTYERVIRTGEIRCAYAVYEPPLIKDPNTGQLSGIFYDVMEEIGRRLSLKINWVEEVGYGTIAEGFVTDRYDAFCNTVWPTPERSRAASFTIPLYYSPVDILVRADDHRFDNDWSKLNDPAYIFAVKDGDVSDTFATQIFPKAKHSSIPDMSDTSQLLVDVVHNKADAAINSPELLYQFLDKNPGTLRDLTPENPINAAPNTIMIKPNQPQFKTMLDVTLQGMLNSGFIDAELQKYKSYHPIYLRDALPYQPGRPAP